MNELQILDEKKFRQMVLDNYRMSKGTVYDYQLCFDMPDGRTISVVHSSELFSKKDLEEILVESVMEAWGKTEVNVWHR